MKRTAAGPQMIHAPGRKTGSSKEILSMKKNKLQLTRETLRNLDLRKSFGGEVVPIIPSVLPITSISCEILTLTQEEEK